MLLVQAPDFKNHLYILILTLRNILYVMLSLVLIQNCVPMVYPCETYLYTHFISINCSRTIMYPFPYCWLFPFSQIFAFINKTVMKIFLHVSQCIYTMEQNG